MMPSSPSIMGTQQTNQFLGRKRLPDGVITTTTQSTPPKRIRTENDLTDQDKYGELIKELVAKRDIRRERCRTNQARYRKKQQKYLTNLEVEIEQLQEEIQKLEKNRQVLSFGIPTKETVWKIAAEYFRLFRHGYIAPTTYAEYQTNGIPRRSNAQYEFLQATMSIDVTNDTVRGVDALLENWRLFSLHHTDVQLQLDRLETGPEGSLVATVKYGITITENTLQNLYPHLQVGDGKWCPLAKRLLHQRIKIIGSICFGWDNSSGRVVSLNTKADLLTPMLRLLGSLENVAHVFSGARISLESARILEPSV
ncbi:hypothetical protein PHPALM_30994 [Phytophthora palmivora]|uniref:Bzip transcription factor n=1 Tax=Phytophthora palmivora TaxID=4796 RepID=A0A2P4X3R1_9STRA|nr:hypothetical protein PHPALM_30994 [Phytophthora palmivora]